MVALGGAGCGPDPGDAALGAPGEPGTERAALAQSPTWREAEPILLEHCSPCHVGPSASACVGGTCLALYYEAAAQMYACCGDASVPASRTPPTSCDAQPVMYCGLQRIYSFVANGKDAVPADQIAILERWFHEGMPR